MGSMADQMWQKKILLIVNLKIQKQKLSEMKPRQKRKTISLIMLNVDGLKISNKRQRLSDQIKISRLTHNYQQKKKNILNLNTLLRLSHFSLVRLCATPQTAAHQAPPSLRFSRQEHWSGLPFPSPMHESEKSK